jgi:toxin secretion/phage lysis holin
MLVRGMEVRFMEKIFNAFSIAAGLAGGWAAYLFGSFDFMLKLLIVLMALDYITGIIKSVYNKKLSSKIGSRGILKKISTLIVIAVANMVQSAVGQNVGIRDLVIMFYAANEGISILENVAAVSDIVPDKLKNLLLQLRGENKGDTDDKNDGDKKNK